MTCAASSWSDGEPVDDAVSVFSLLTAAVVDGDESRVQDLLRQGSCDINERDEMGLWPLLAAIRCQNPAVTQLLLDHGARSRKNRSRRSELHVLAATQKGPFPAAPTTVGARWVNSIQSWLVPSPSIILWQQLLTAGAHPLSADRNGVTAFHIACARGNWPAVQFLIQGKHVVDINKADKEGETALHYAARFGREAVVSLLLSHRANTLAVAKQGRAAEVARLAGHQAVAELIESWSYKACPILLMPFDVLVRVMEHLEPQDLCAIAQVCSRLNEVSSADCLWHRYCDSKWVDVEGERWKHRYMDWLQPRLKQYASNKVRGRPVEFRCKKSYGVIEEVTSSPADYDHLFKFILIGDAGVGKTALQERFIWNNFTTHRSSIRGDFGIRLIDVDGILIKLQVWDTAGQERFQTITRTYYRGTSGVAVVYDITRRESFGSVKRWVEDSGLYHDDADAMPAFILVGAKSDLHATRQVSQEEGQALALELGAVGWAETSSSNGSGVYEMFYRLTQSALAGVEPFIGPPNGGCHVPSEAVLQQLYSASNVGPKAVVSRAALEASCVLQ